MIKKLKRKHGFFAKRRNTHDDYFMDDSEYRMQVMYESNKEFFDNAMGTLTRAIRASSVTAQEACEALSSIASTGVGE